MSKNNQREMVRKMKDQRQRFAIRKYSVGVASVLIGLTFLGGTAVVHADTPESEQPTQLTLAPDTSSTTVPTEDQANHQVTNKAFPSQDQEKPVSKPAANVAPASVTPSSVPAYNIADWNYTTNTDNSGITLTKYIGQGTDYYIPNAKSFRDAGKLQAGQRVYVDYGFVSGLVRGTNNISANGPATSISFERAADPNDQIVVNGYTDKDGTQKANAMFGADFDNNNDAGEKGNQTLKTIDVAGLDVSQLHNMSGLFANDKALESVTGLDAWNLNPNNYSIGHMFAFDDNLKTVVGMNSWDTNNLKYIDNLFLNDANLTGNIDFSKWNTNNVVLANSMFEGAKSLTSVGDLSGWRLPNVLTTKNMFRNMYSLTNLGNLDQWGLGKDTTMNSMFAHDYKLTNIGNIGGWDVSNVTDMEKMFDTCASLTTPGNLANWNVAKVTDMSQMFRGHIDQDVSPAQYFGDQITINGHVYRIGAMNSVGDLSKWNVANVTDMAGMFEGTRISNLGDLSGWNTNKVTNMDYMFEAMPYLEAKWDLSKWNQSGQLQVAYNMFEASGVRSVNVSNWKFASTAGKTPGDRINSGQGHDRITNMFRDLYNPATITINGWQGAPASLTAADFDSDQPLIVLSAGTLDLNALNKDGHKANTVTFVAKSNPGTGIASQQEDFVFKDNDALQAALHKITTVENWGNFNVTVNGKTHSLKDVAESGAWLNGKHNATGTTDGRTDYDIDVNGGSANDYSKIAGTYALTGKTTNVTADQNYKQQSIARTFHIIEKLPDGNGETTDKTIWTLDTAQYRQATLNQLTGEVTYGNYTDQSGSGEDPYNIYTMRGQNWEQGTNANGHLDKTAGWGTYDVPAGYTADLHLKDLPDGQKSPIHISYDQTKRTYNIDIYWGAQPLDSFPENQDFCITYTANAAQQTINYQDEQGNVIGSQVINGHTDQTKPYSPSLPAGWVLDQSVPASIKLSATDTPITIKVKHGTVTVTEPTNPRDQMPNNSSLTYPSVSSNDLNKTLTRTITITKPDGTKVDQTQKLAFKRNATIDTVTGLITYGDWIPLNESQVAFNQVNIPGVQDYTPSQASIPAIGSLTQAEINNWQDQPINISYTPNERQQVVQFVDGYGHVIATTVVSGRPGDQVRVKIPAAYAQDADETMLVTISADGKLITIHLTKLANENQQDVPRHNGSVTRNTRVVTNQNERTNPQNQTSRAQLPQTGNENGSMTLGFAAMLLAATLSLLGGPRRKKD